MNVMDPLVALNLSQSLLFTFHVYSSTRNLSSLNCNLIVHEDETFHTMLPFAIDLQPHQEDQAYVGEMLWRVQGKRDEGIEFGFQDCASFDDPTSSFVTFPASLSHKLTSSLITQFRIIFLEDPHPTRHSIPTEDPSFWIIVIDLCVVAVAVVSWLQAVARWLLGFHDHGHRSLVWRSSTPSRVNLRVSIRRNGEEGHQTTELMSTSHPQPNEALDAFRASSPLPQEIYPPLLLLRNVSSFACSRSSHSPSRHIMDSEASNSVWSVIPYTSHDSGCHVATFTQVWNFRPDADYQELVTSDQINSQVWHLDWRVVPFNCELFLFDAAHYNQVKCLPKPVLESNFLLSAESEMLRCSFHSAGVLRPPNTSNNELSQWQQDWNFAPYVNQRITWGICDLKEFTLLGSIPAFVLRGRPSEDDACSASCKTWHLEWKVIPFIPQGSALSRPVNIFQRMGWLDMGYRRSYDLRKGSSPSWHLEWIVVPFSLVDVARESGMMRSAGWSSLDLGSLFERYSAST